MPSSADIDVWEEASDGTVIVTRMLVLPAVTRMAISEVFTLNRLARAVRNCIWKAPVKSEG